MTDVLRLLVAGLVSMPLLAPAARAADVAPSEVAAGKTGEEAVATEADGDGPRIEFDSYESVTVVGRSESLKSLLESLCTETGVELREFNAPDRIVRARYRNRPLSTVFERLLKEENFVIGFVQGAGDSRPRPKWLRVVGAASNKPSPRPAAATAAARFVLPRAAFANSAASTRRRVRTGFISRLNRDPQYKAKFLAGDEAAMAKQLADHAHVREFLSGVRAGVRDGRVRNKINRLLVSATR